MTNDAWSVWTYSSLSGFILDTLPAHSSLVTGGWCNELFPYMEAYIALQTSSDIYNIKYTIGINWSRLVIWLSLGPSFHTWYFLWISCMRETSRPVSFGQCSKLLAVGKRSNAMRRFSLKQGKHVTNHILRMRSICPSQLEMLFFFFESSLPYGADRQIIPGTWSLFDFGKFQRAQESPDFTDDLPRSLYQTCLNMSEPFHHGNVSWFCFRARCWWLRFCVVFALKEPATQSPPHKDLRMAGRRKERLKWNASQVFCDAKKREFSEACDASVRKSNTRFSKSQDFWGFTM